MRRARTAIAIAASLSVPLGPGGCADPDRPRVPPSGGAEAEAEASTAAGAARFLNAFAFTGTVPGSSLLYLELTQRTTERSLARDYRGWLSEDEEGWRPFLRLRDTLPIPRAAWRIVPGGGLRLQVGDGARIVSLSLQDSARRLRLRPGRILAEWTGPTGQREFFALATLERDSISQPGLLHFRRAARTATAPPDRAADRLLLLGDSRGNGFLVAQTEAEAETESFAWGWLDGARSRWSGVRFRREGPDSWSLVIPAPGIAAELTSVDPGAASPPPPAALVRGTLEAPDGERRAVHGLLVDGRLP